MNETKEHYTILFSDIVGSSTMYSNLGNPKAEEKINFTINTISACATRYNGKIIKTIGDELMCSFNNTSDANTATSALKFNTP
jgi:adenylate cyclase